MRRFCLFVRRIWSWPGRAILRGEIADLSQGLVANAAAGKANADPVKVALLLLVDAEVIGLLVRDVRKILVRFQLEAEQRLHLLAASRVVPPVRHEKLEARVVALQAVAVVAEDLAHGFHHRPDLLRAEEDLEQLRQLRRRGQVRRRS